MKFDTYFSSKYIFSKGALWNIVLSDRSDGKTTDIKYLILKNYKENKHVSVYLRRYKTETGTELKTDFFKKTIEIYPEFKTWKFQTQGNIISVSTDGGKSFNILCHVLPLTMTGKLKSSLYEDNIFDIFYDEFVPLDGRYIKDEIDILMEFWKSVDRDRDIVRMLICGNKITPFNPLFDYFKIKLDIASDKKTIRLYQDGTLAVQIYYCPEHREKRKESRFNSLIKGTKYEDYDNGGILHKLNLLKKNTTDCTYLYSFKTSVGEGSIWRDENGNLIVSEKKRKDGFLIVDEIYNTGREEIAINFSKFPLFFKNKYRLGKIAFDSDSAFNSFQDILTKIK